MLVWFSFSVVGWVCASTREEEKKKKELEQKKKKKKNAVLQKMGGLIWELIGAHEMPSFRNPPVFCFDLFVFESLKLWLD